MNRRGILVFRELLGWRIRILGQQNIPMQPCIIAANHQSYLDPVMLWIAAGPRVAKAMVGVTNPNIARGFTKTFGRWALGWLGMLPVDREQPGAAIESAARRIEAGDAVGIFPEGTRNRGPQERLLPGKTGVARLALKTGAPIVPVGIVAPPGLTTGQAVRSFFFTRKPAEVRFGEPLRFPKTPEAQWTSEQIERVVEDVMRAISRLSGRAYTPRPTKT